MITNGLSYRLSDESFTNFSEALRNAKAERLSTPNVLSITFVFFSVSCNTEYLSIGNLLSTIVKKDYTLWSLLRETTEENSMS